MPRPEERVWVAMRVGVKEKEEEKNEKNEC